MTRAKTRKVVINKCYGGFSVSQDLIEELGFNKDNFIKHSHYLDNKDFGIDSEDYLAYRASPKLIKAIKKIGLIESGGGFAELQIVTIPSDIDWHIDNYDGMESLHEEHRSW